MARQLFIVGPGRSGTTAMMRYLNDHPRILVLKERYKFIPHEVTPEMFTRERVLKRIPEETNLPPEEDEKNLRNKNLSRLRWFGDKVPGFVRYMPTLTKNNPQSRFIVMRRPLEEVAASYAARAANPNDRWLGGKDGVGIAIRDWKRAYKNAERFAKRLPRRVLMIDHALLLEPEALAEKLEPFLNVRFDAVLERWEERGREWQSQAPALSEENLRRIREAE